MPYNFEPFDESSYYRFGKNKPKKETPSEESEPSVDSRRILPTNADPWPVKKASQPTVVNVTHKPGDGNKSVYYDPMLLSELERDLYKDSDIEKLVGQFATKGSIDYPQEII